MSYNARAYFAEKVSADSEHHIIYSFTAQPATLAVHASGEGVSAFVEISISSDERLRNGSALWVTADGFGESGVVTGSSVMNVIPSTVTAVRVTADGGEVVVEFQQ